MQATKIDLLIHCRWIIPIVPENQILENCSLAVDGGKIIGTYPRAEADKKFTADKVEHLNDHLVMPGLVNAHGHAAMSLLRGYADDLALRPWLEDHIWPAENRHVSAEFVTDGTNLAMAEMIASGTTCFADMYFLMRLLPRQSATPACAARLALPCWILPALMARCRKAADIGAIRCRQACDSA